MPEQDSDKTLHRDIIIERVRIKNTLRITAIDAETGTEVTFQAPANTSKSELDRLALKKLDYVIKRQKEDFVEK